jgi:hypothetical protein
MVQSMQVAPPTGRHALDQSHFHQMKNAIKLNIGHSRVAKVVHVPGRLDLFCNRNVK